MQKAAAGRKIRSENLPSTAEFRRRKTERKVQAEEVASKILLLNLEMPNGKAMRLCTGAEMAGFGTAYSRIAEQVGADCLVGEVLCENEAAELLQSSAAVSIGAGIIQKSSRINPSISFGMR